MILCCYADFTEPGETTFKSMLPNTFTYKIQYRMEKGLSNSHRAIDSIAKFYRGGRGAQLVCGKYYSVLARKVYIGSGLKVPTEINGFLLSFYASLYQKRKIENLILF